MYLWEGKCIFQKKTYATFRPGELKQLINILVLENINQCVGFFSVGVLIMSKGASDMTSERSERSSRIYCSSNLDPTSGKSWANQRFCNNIFERVWKTSWVSLFILEKAVMWERQQYGHIGLWGRIKGGTPQPFLFSQ